MSKSAADKKGRELALGSVLLGHYRIVRQLAKGGMSVIYLGRNEGAAGFVRPVAIKQSMAGHDSDVLAMFAREARILSALRHRGIVSILDFAEEGGDYVMVLDYVHGYTLSQWYRYRREVGLGVPPELACYVAVQVLEALHHAHSLTDAESVPLGIVHRDVKPSNVLIDVTGAVKLADFGIARAHGDATDVTTTGSALKGTFGYMAPELFAHAAPSPVTDTYSAALMLYEVLAGRHPFLAADTPKTVARVLHVAPPQLSALREDVPRSLCNAVAKSMCKHPDGRHRSAQELADALRDALPIDEREVAAEFGRAVQRDFHDPRFLALHGVMSLADREAAWLRAGTETGVRALPLEPDDLEPTELRRSRRGSPTPPLDLHSSPTAVLQGHVPLPGDPAPAPAPAPPQPGAIRWLVPALVLAAAGAGALWWSQRSPAQTQARPQQTVVLVRGDVTAERDAAPAQVAPPDAGVATVASAPDAAPAKSKSPRPKPSAEDELAATFRKRGPELRRCFEQHAAEVAGAPQLSVKFRVGKNGRVMEAALLPEAVGQTALGRCVLDVARATAFAPRREPITFRIPVRVYEQ